MLVHLENVKKRFHGVTAVDGVSLRVESGELVALIGPSGCGKSTLLRCINGLEALDEGRIEVLDAVLQPQSEIGAREFHRRAQKIRENAGMVFQSFNLFPHLTVGENIVKPLMVVRGFERARAEALALDLLKKVGLEEKIERHPVQLSGGQQQRAAIARALAMSPKVILYDEPTSALDPALVGEVLRVMKQLDSEGMTQIVVTHEMRFARDVADRIVFLVSGQVVEMGPPSEIFSNPRDPRLREFLRHFL